MRLLWAGTIRDRLRLWSGLVLFTFALTHFLNHALGIWSVDAMNAAQSWRVAATRSPPGTALLVAASLTHVGLALWKLSNLGTWRLGRAEIAQGLSGLAIPLLLMPHLFESGVGPRAARIVASYPAVLGLIWPEAMVWQTLLLLVVWLHGCLGLHYWLRGESWYRRGSHALAALAALVPALALAGVVVAGRAVAAGPPPSGGLSPATVAILKTAAHRWQAASYLLIALALAASALRFWAFRPSARMTIAYADGPTLASPIGPTLLEISRANRVPHLSICGGKARCSTCRVKVLAGLETLDPPEEAETRLLRRIGAPADVRLACQIRPTRPIAVARVLKPESHGAAGPAGGGDSAGVDRVAAVLFVDIRGFTRLAQAKLAYDVVYILNSFFAVVGRAIEAAGGRVDKYMGDGLMAVFDHPEGLNSASRAAIDAIVAIHRELAAINRQLSGEISEPLRLAMGLHGGRLVVGRIGWGSAALPTVIGPAVNVASRLESLAKSRNVELALSRECAVAAGLAIGALMIEDVEIRGVEGPFPAVLVADVGALAAAPAA